MNHNQHLKDKMKDKIYPRTGDKQTVYLKAVVTKDVEPYAIVGGVPAKEIRKRFSPEKIEKLQSLKWWNWPTEKIRRSIPAIQSGDIESLMTAK